MRGSRLPRDRVGTYEACMCKARGVPCGKVKGPILGVAVLSCSRCGRVARKSQRLRNPDLYPLVILIRSIDCPYVCSPRLVFFLPSGDFHGSHSWFGSQLRKDYLANGDTRCVIGTIVQEPRQIKITSSTYITKPSQASKETTARVK